MYNITVIPGDGIGPEVTEATLKVLEASGVSFHWQTAEMGHGAWERHRNPVPSETVAAMRKSDASLKGRDPAPRPGAHPTAAPTSPAGWNLTSSPAPALARPTVVCGHPFPVPTWC